MAALVPVEWTGCTAGEENISKYDTYGKLAMGHVLMYKLHHEKG